MSAVLGYQQVYVRQRRSLFISNRMIAALVCSLIAVLGTKVWVQATITDLGYRIGHERVRARDLEGTIRELSLARSVLLRPRTLQAEARSRIGLAPLAPRQALKISPTSVSTSFGHGSR